MSEASRRTELSTTSDCVGPVLQSGADADAVIEAIRALNPKMRLLDRGAYVRVLVPHRCVVTREAIEARVCRPFRLPRDLEAIMSSFKGRFRVNADEASWEVGRG
jgi:toluene monooxygenase system protein D